MNHWRLFSEAAPELAAFGQQRIQGRISYLATVRPDGSPRVHPVSPFIAQGQLFLYMEPTSPKAGDLRREPRYAMHCSVEDNSGGEGEFLIIGRGRLVDDAALRNVAFEQARAIGYSPKERYILFELSVEEAASTVYKDGGPDRSKWKAGAG